MIIRENDGKLKYSYTEFDPAKVKKITVRNVDYGTMKVFIKCEGISDPEEISITNGEIIPLEYDSTTEKVIYQGRVLQQFDFNDNKTSDNMNFNGYSGGTNRVITYVPSMEASDQHLVDLALGVCYSVVDHDGIGVQNAAVFKSKLKENDDSEIIIEIKKNEFKPEKIENVYFLNEDFGRMKIRVRIEGTTDESIDLDDGEIIEMSYSYNGSGKVRYDKDGHGYPMQQLDLNDDDKADDVNFNGYSGGKFGRITYIPDSKAGDKFVVDLEGGKCYLVEDKDGINGSSAMLIYGEIGEENEVFIKAKKK